MSTNLVHTKIKYRMLGHILTYVVELHQSLSVGHSISRVGIRVGNSDLTTSDDSDHGKLVDVGHWSISLLRTWLSGMGP